MMIKNLGRFVFLFLPIFLYANIEFQQHISKTNFYLNETIKVSLELRVSDDLLIDNVYFEKYENSDFLVEELSNKRIIKENNETLYIYEYLLNPKNIGSFILPKQKIEITSQNIRRFKSWEKVYSNELDIKINPLAENLTILGKYSLTTIFENKKYKQNDPISFEIKIDGFGNIQDINPFILSLNEQMVYSDKPIIYKEFMENFYKGKFSQKFLIIANKSFTIPSFELKYFDTTKNSIETIISKPIFVEVEEVKQNIGDDYRLKYVFLLVGFVLGLICFLGYKFLKRRFKKESDLSKKIRKTKSDKELYILLISLVNRDVFKGEIRALEENIYDKKSNFINKKELIKKLNKQQKD